MLLHAAHPTLHKPVAQRLEHVELHRPASELSVVGDYRFQDNFIGPDFALGLVPDAKTRGIPFRVGQVVDIIQDPGFTNDSYNGFHTITQILNLDQFDALLRDLGVEDTKSFDAVYNLQPFALFPVFDIPFGDPSPIEGGVILPVKR
jgi:hypothetical protein